MYTNAHTDTYTSISTHTDTHIYSDRKKIKKNQILKEIKYSEY